MEFIRTNGGIFWDPDVLPQNGIVFILARWSGYSLSSLNFLIKQLENFPTTNLYVLDIDNQMARSFQNKYQVLSHGYGETFWLQENEILFTILRYRQEEMDKIVCYTEKMLGKNSFAFVATRPTLGDNK